MTSTEGTQQAPQHAITRCAAQLARALDTAQPAAAWSMSADEQRAALGELARVEARLAELRLRVLAAADINEVGTINGSSSTAAWLANETRQTRASAHSDRRLALDLDKGFEATRVALGEGRINADQARVIVHAVNDLPDKVGALDRGRAEAHLIQEAARWDAKALRILGRRLFEVIDPDAADEHEGEKLRKEEEEARRKAMFRIHDNGDGTSSGRFKLPTLHAQALVKVLHALTAPRRVGKEGRSDAEGNKLPQHELLGRGFMELLERMPLDKLPNCGGVSSTIIVTMTLEQLEGRLGAAGLDTGGKISAGEARRLCCEAGLIPVVLGGDSMPLDVGREQRFHTKAQRTAMGVRDGGCTAETCDRPPGWCESHHEEEWAKGGETSVEKGRLLCWWHHHLAHDSSYSMKRLGNGKVRFRRRQ